jgi:Fe-coproporphyrin III synthase
MECAVITTYRCNARCQMCNIWNFPTNREEEFNPQILKKLPSGMKRLNITGGEPTIRENLIDILEILINKTKSLEISTNGFYTDKLVAIGRKYPNIMIRVSVEGLPQKNDFLRGTPNGFDHALRSILHLKELGLKNIGFAMVISDRNVSDLLDIYRLSAGLGIEFSTSTLHNSFYFHKKDNIIEDPEIAINGTLQYLDALLRSKRSNLKLRIKDWLRAYLNYGLILHMRGLSRPLECMAGTDTFFVDPWGRIIACNGSEDPWIMGDLNKQSFEEIWESPTAQMIRIKVKNCKRDCWMMGTAVPAMRRSPWRPISWVIKNKLNSTFNKNLNYKLI